MLTLEYAKDPVYGDATGNNIQLIVKWEEFPQEMPFGATTYDPHDHGRDLFERAEAGEFGPIAAYVASPVSANNQPSTQGSQDL